MWDTGRMYFKTSTRIFAHKATRGTILQGYRPIYVLEFLFYCKISCNILLHFSVVLPSILIHFNRITIAGAFWSTKIWPTSSNTLRARKTMRRRAAVRGLRPVSSPTGRSPAHRMLSYAQCAGTRTRPLKEGHVMARWCIHAQFTHACEELQPEQENLASRVNSWFINSWVNLWLVISRAFFIGLFNGWIIISQDFLDQGHMSHARFLYFSISLIISRSEGPTSYYFYTNFLYNSGGT